MASDPVGKTASEAKTPVNTGTSSSIQTSREEEGRALSETVGGQFDVNSSHLRFWNNNFYFSAFRPGEQGVAVGTSVAYKNSLFRYNNDNFLLKGLGSIGVFNLWPEENFDTRNVFGFGSSLILFGGAKQKLGPISFREGVEAGTYLYLGKNLSPVVALPFSIGAAIGIESSKERAIWLNGSIKNYVISADVQDPWDLAPFFSEAIVGLSAKLHNTQFNFDYHIFHNESQRVNASLIHRFANLFGESVSASAGIEGGYDLTGGQPGNYVLQSGNYVGATFVLNWNSGKKKQGASFRTSIAQNNSPFTGYETGKVKNLPLFNPSPIGKNVACKHNSSGNGPGDCFWVNAYSGPHLDNSNDVSLNCHDMGDYMKCYLPGSSFYVNVVEYKEPSSSGFYSYYTVEDIGSNDPIVKTILSNKNFDDMLSAGKKLSNDQQLILLNYLAQLAYRTADMQAGLLSEGMGKTNSIKAKEIYSALHDGFKDANNLRPTTVCRGFAKFITGIANSWGFEAHSVSIQTTKGTGHVITVLRDKSGYSDYSVINYGTGPIFKSPHRDISRVVQDYCIKNGYPPQLQNWSYGPDGSPEGIIEPPTFGELREATEPEWPLKNYLEGK